MAYIHEDEKGITDDEFLSMLNAYWNSCGPWLDKESLSEDSKRVQEAFKRMLSDTRLVFGQAIHYSQ